MAFSISELYEKQFKHLPPAKMFTYDDEQMFALVWERVAELSKGTKPAHISLFGGSTVFKLFAALETLNLSSTINWDNLHFWWNDERLVPYASSSSNYGELYRKYLSHLPIPQKNLHPVSELAQVNSETVAQEVARLDALTKELVAGDAEGVPAFDLVILGLGDDGHSASLFPGKFNPADERLHFDALHPQTAEPRITQGIELLKHAKEVIFLATGEAKAPVLAEIMSFVTYRPEFVDLETDQVDKDDPEFYNAIWTLRTMLMDPNRFIYPAVILAEYVDNVKFIFDKPLFDKIEQIISSYEF